LDPFDEFTDDEVWDVLKSVNMVDHVQSLPNKLAENVAEGGDNFSAGQRQVSRFRFFICLIHFISGFFLNSLSALQEQFFASLRF
jgi:hypothetical protein